MLLSYAAEMKGVSDVPAKAPGAMVSPMDGLYLVGSFNDWQLPDANGDNGAIRFESEDGERYVCTVDLPAGDADMKIYWGEASDAACKYIGTDASRFELLQVLAANDPFYTEANPIYGSSRPYAMPFAYAEALDDVRPFGLYNWQGGEVTVVVANAAANSRYCYLESTVAPMFKRPNAEEGIYAIVNVGTPSPIIKYIPIGFENAYQSSYKFEGRNVSVILSSEKSASPAAESVWGLLEDNPLSELLTGEAIKQGNVHFGPGGDSFEYSFKNWGSLQVNASWAYRTAYVSANESVEPPYEFRARAVIDDQPEIRQTSLFKEEDGYVCEFEFRGKSIRIPWIEMAYSSGGAASHYYKYYSTADESDNSFQVDGNSRVIPMLEDRGQEIVAEFAEWGCVNLKFNYLDMTAELTTTEEPRSGVGVVGAECSYEGEVSYYTLEGLKSDGSRPGIYLRKSNLGVRKVVVR